MEEIPGHLFVDGISWDAFVVHRNGNRARGVPFVPLDETRFEAVALQRVQDFIAQVVFPHGANHDAPGTQGLCMIGEIRWCPAELCCCRTPRSRCMPDPRGGVVVYPSSGPSDYHPSGKRVQGKKCPSSAHPGERTGGTGGPL